jgi:hypothetical protein
MQQQFRQNKGIDCAYYLGFTHLRNPAFPADMLLQKSHFGQLRYNRSELTSLPCPCGVPAASIAIALDMEVRSPCGAYFQIICGGFFNDRKSDYARWEIKKFGQCGR